jgi:hypothetical protein
MAFSMNDDERPPVADPYVFVLTGADGGFVMTEDGRGIWLPTDAADSDGAKPKAAADV